MARRRNRSRLPATKPVVYGAALTALNMLERRYCYRTVTCHFTPTDIVEWLIEPLLLERLRHAETIRRELDSVAFMGHRMVAYDPKVMLPFGTVWLHVDTTSTPYVCPKDEVGSPQITAMSKHIEECLSQVAAVYARFEQARKVVRWFEENATLGATKFYFPSMVSLLPSEHLIHGAGGNIYREPKRPVAEIAADARAAMTTIAMGLMTTETEHEAKDVKVEIYNNNESNPPLDTTRSQLFCLV